MIRRFLVSLLLLAPVAFAPAAPGLAKERPLRALVFENTDPKELGMGTKSALAGAGFEVLELSLDASPTSKRADLLVLGAWASKHPDYTAYLKKHRRAIQSFVKRGGVLYVATQADDVEVEPPYLPKGMRAFRGDQDLQELRPADPDHPLVRGLAPDANDPGRLHVRTIGGFPVSNETFAWHEGMRAILTSNAAGDLYALLEGAHGKGRILLSSLLWDGCRKADGSPRYSEAGMALVAQFFGNLAAYVRSVRDGTAPDVVPTPPPDPDRPPEGAPRLLAWNVARSDVLVYTRRGVRKLGRARAHRGSKELCLHGHDLRRDGQWLPLDARRSDLARLLAFQVPTSADPEERFEREFTLHRTVPLRVRGTLTAHAMEGATTAEIRGTYTLEARGRGDDETTHGIEDGTARVRARFDVAKGAITHAEIDLEYELVDLRKKGHEGRERKSETFDWDLTEERRHKHEGFHDQVDAAIKKGSDWLKGRRKDDGRWPHHGSHKVGSESLAILTLLACGVPKDDPAITETIAWILAQDPRRTYDRAVALMALDKFHAPPGESAAVRSGRHVKRKRDVPPDHMEWVTRQAKALEETAAQPGSWGYPNGGNDLQRFDTSNTQYAVLGLRAARHMGYPVSERTWLGVLRHFEIVREKDGPKGSVALIRRGQAIRDEATTTSAPIAVREVAGFRYTPLHGHRFPWGSMTCAGIASLAIARHELQLLGSPKMSPKVAETIEEAILGAWAWLDLHWAVDRHPKQSSWYFYYLYSLERAAEIHGVSRVGGRDWYFSGASELLVRQKDKGEWGSMTETCFALLFLKRATTPLTGR